MVRGRNPLGSKFMILDKFNALAVSFFDFFSVLPVVGEAHVTGPYQKPRVWRPWWYVNRQGQIKTCIASSPPGPGSRVVCSCAHQVQLPQMER